VRKQKQRLTQACVTTGRPGLRCRRPGMTDQFWMACTAGRGGVKKQCRVKDMKFIALLDAWADINSEIEATAISAGSPIQQITSKIHVIGGEVSSTRATNLEVEIGSVQDNNQAYVIRKAPVDIVLGNLFFGETQPGILAHAEGIQECKDKERV